MLRLSPPSHLIWLGDHFILDIYDRADLYEWLLQQKRGKNRF